MKDKPLEDQLETLKSIVLLNPYIKNILECGDTLFQKPVSWYLGAGCVCQSVWNYMVHKELTEGIKDYDLVYYDGNDLDPNSEVVMQEQVIKLLGSGFPKVEVVNEARVHQWFSQDFGTEIQQFASCEDAINKWPTTATCVGVTIVNGNLKVYAPYGLNDLFNMTVRPNKLLLSKDNYQEKVARWLNKWPNLKIIPWD